MRRIIQVGVGGMGQVWADRVAESDQWEAAAYVDVNKKNLTAAAARHGMPQSRCFSDLEEALRRIEADALLDATPQKARKQVCTAALKRGLDVLSEKPLADNLRNAQALVSCAAKQKRTFMVAQNYRYQPIVQTVKRFVEKGRLGKVGYVGIQFHKGPQFGGYREEMAYPLVLDMSIHHFDMLRCIFSSDIVWVQAASLNAPWNWNKGDATVMAQLMMKNGMLVNYFGSWVARGAETSWNADWRIEGDAGALIWEDDALRFAKTAGPGRKVPLVKWPTAHQAYLLKVFAEALNQGTEPETSGRQNLNSLAATYAVVNAIRKGQRVTLAETLGSSARARGGKARKKTP